MLKKYCLVCSIVLLVSCSLYAQNSDSAIVSVRYTFIHVVDSTQPDNPNLANMILYIGKTKSYYTSYDAILRMEQISERQKRTAILAGKLATEASGPGRVDRVSDVMSNPLERHLLQAGSFYKDFSTHILSAIVLADLKLFSVEDKIPEIKWEISNETKDIKGMFCQKATSRFCGRNYEAWFCSQLPYNNGPWKLGGLPGLILEASDSKKEVVFQFAAFENVSNIKIELPADVIKTTPKKYTRYQAAAQKDNSVSELTKMGIKKMDDSMNNDGSKAVRKREVNNPIEKTADL